MVVVIFNVFIVGLMMWSIVKHGTEPGYQDRIIGFSFLIVFSIGIGLLGIKYFHDNYIYFEETKREIGIIEVLEIKDGKYFKQDDGKYYFYKKEDRTLYDISEEDVIDVVSLEEGKPYIVVYEIERMYDVENHGMFNFMIGFRFSDYTEIEEVYEIRADAMQIMH